MLVKDKKVKKDGETIVKRKRRIVLDGTGAQTKRTINKAERVLLPRSIDVVHDSIDLLGTASSNDAFSEEPSRARDKTVEVEYLIADFEDPFWQVPTHPS